MGSERVRPLRCRAPLAVGAVLAALVSSCVAVTSRGPQITVMTQNLYLGTGLGDAFAATTWEQLAAAGSSIWANVLARDFPTRAGVLADQIVRARPDVVALQEVTLWRDQTPSDVRTHPAPNAAHVALDYLAILLQALRARGVPYTAAVTSPGADLELPRHAAGGLVDLRLTDRDAVIVRSDVARRVGNPRHGHYAAQLRGPFLPQPVSSTRSWESLDFHLDRATTVRIFATHLEVADPGTGTIQEQQARELLRRIAASPYPVLAIGDFNAPAGGAAPRTRTYRALTARLHDAWTAARPADPGWTCCQAASLADPVGRERMRIDLVLTTGNWPVAHVERTDGRPFRAGPPPLWPSDHLGLTARLTVP